MDSKKLLIYLFFLSPLAVWFSLIVLAPYLASVGCPFSGFLYFFFSETCHQLPGRSFFLYGFKLAVCARCTGIYLGALVSTLFYPFFLPVDNKKTPGKFLLLFSLIPLGLDGGIQLLTAYESTNLLRFFTGLVFGGVLPLYLLPVYNELVYGFLSNRRGIL
ncbi:MAG: DUF2085 domain-containing protein [Candidatus Altiarchaeota archaeon]|nr:DUF2085 domain-containing protein [Candidatus Altiarchaeota archaeon]